MLIVLLKLLSSAATLTFALGYATRRRSPWHHRRLMGLGVSLAAVVPLILLVAVLGFGESLRTGYWLVDLLGGHGPASWVTGGHQVLFALALMVLAAQAGLGVWRAPAHRLLAGVAIALWVPAWVGGMFLYF